MQRRDVDERLHLDLLVEVGVDLPDAGDGAERDAAREQRGEVAVAPAGGDDGVARRDDLILGDAIEHERVGAGAAVADDAGRARRQVEHRYGECPIGDEGHLGDGRGDLGHLPDESLLGDDGVVQAEPAVRAGGDGDALVELAGRAGDHGDRHRAVARREAGAVHVGEKAAQPGVLLRRGLVDDELASQVVHLRAQRTVLVTRRREAARPVGEIAEGERHLVGGNLERMQHLGAGALQVVHGAAARLAEVAGDQRERENDQAEHDEPPAQPATRALREARGNRTPGGSEHGHAGGAVARHGRDGTGGSTRQPCSPAMAPSERHRGHAAPRTRCACGSTSSG